MYCVLQADNEEQTQDTVYRVDIQLAQRFPSNKIERSHFSRYTRSVLYLEKRL